MFLYSQDGFDVIRHAEKKIEQGKYEKALQLLDKADTMDYGFCGNAWMEAREAITLDRVKIYEAQGDYLEAANTLNSADLFYRDNIDSLKTAYYIKVLDKEIMKSEIDSCIALITSIDSVDFLMGLSFNVTFIDEPFRISNATLRYVRMDTFLQTEENKNIPQLDRFKSSLVRQPFYLLLK